VGSDLEGVELLGQGLPLVGHDFWNDGQRLRDKGYSIYVVDDEHEIHRFDLDTYEWSIIQTNKDID